MSLASDIGLRGIILGIERVKVLLKILVGRDAGYRSRSELPLLIRFSC